MSSKKVVIYGVFMGISLIALLSLGGILLAQSNRQDADEGEAAYVVKAYEGHLAVFEEGDPRPSQLYEDVWILSFPPEEQRKLANGIPVADHAALMRVLEDYTS